ncbi:MAG TPA: ROK family transcriptional regulator [Streptosporangiaceae bacterium]|jgi:glucokinase
MDVGNIAELNTFLLLDALRSHGQATRRELSRELGLSDASVSRIVKRLLASGIVEELPGDGGAAGVTGRTPSILRFLGPPGAVIAVDLGGTRCHGALADLSGQTLATDFRTLGAGGNDGHAESAAEDGSKHAATTLLECIAALTASAAALAVPVRAVVVGIPALIDPVSQLATAGPNVRWQGFDLLGILGDQLKTPFEVDNDVNLAALGEAWRGQGRGIRSFVTISIGTGIGGAVIMDGHLLRGAHNAAGEVAYVPLWRWPKLPATPGAHAEAARRGFEDVASGPALHARATELRRQGVPTRLRSGFPVADIFAAAAAGDELGAQVVRELTSYVAAVVVGITALVDPERVILGGAVGQALLPWLAEIEAAVSAAVFRAPGIVVSGLGQDAAVTGAIARALALVSELDVPAHLSEQVRSAVGRRPRAASE